MSRISHDTLEVIAIANYFMMLFNGMICLDGGVECGVGDLHRR